MRLRAFVRTLLKAEGADTSELPARDSGESIPDYVAMVREYLAKHRHRAAAGIVSQIPLHDGNSLDDKWGRFSRTVLSPWYAEYRKSEKSATKRPMPEVEEEVEEEQPRKEPKAVTYDVMIGELYGEKDEPQSKTFERYLGRAARYVHNDLGPGLTEAIYRNALAIDLRHHGYLASTEVPVPVVFDGECIGTIRADLVTNELGPGPGRGLVSRIVELKVAAKITAAHVAQAKAYLRRSPKGSTAYVVNFGTDVVEMHVVEPESGASV